MRAPLQPRGPGVSVVALMGARHASGEFDAVFARIDALMREAGVVSGGRADAGAIDPKAQRVAYRGDGPHCH